MTSDTESSKTTLQDVFKNLKFDDIINQALINTLTEDAKNSMMENIMSYLTSVEGNSYYNKKTVLQNIFEGSIRDPIRKTMHEVVSTDTRITEKCREIAKQSVDRFIQKDVNKMVDVMVERMCNAFEEKESRY